MWVFCKSGFYSVVQHRDLPNELLVRCRAREDAEKLIEWLNANLVAYIDEDTGAATEAEKYEVEETPEADYRFRVLVPRIEFMNFMADEVFALDYPNFKEEIEKQADGDFHRCTVYSWVWRNMLDFQTAKSKKERLHDRI